MSRAPTNAELVVGILSQIGITFHRMRAVGRSRGAVTPWGGGLFAVIRNLKVDGPMTVPQLARVRPVARQRIQRLADDAAAEGLVEFVENPAHKRSKLVQLTPKGEAWHDDLLAMLLQEAEVWTKGLDTADLQTTADTLGALAAGLLETIEDDALPPLDEG